MDLFSLSTMIRILALTASACLCASNACAIGFLTQMNCASDYYAYCSQFQVGSKELRLCMRRAGPKLSKACLDALIADGEVSKAEVEKRKQEIAAAKNETKQKAAAEQKLVEASPKRETLVLDETTFTALKQREPRFVEIASAAEASNSEQPPKVLDPQSESLEARPSLAHETTSEEPSERSKVASRSKATKRREAVEHAKNKTVAHRLATKRAREASGHKNQTASD